MIENVLGHDIDTFKGMNRDPEDVQKCLTQAAEAAEEKEKAAKSRMSESRLPGDFLATDSEDDEEALQEAIRQSRQEAEDESQIRKGEGGSSSSTRWVPSLRTDRTTGEPVLTVKETEGPKRRRKERSPSPDSAMGDLTKVTLKTNAGFRKFSIWVPTKTFDSLKDMDPDTLH